MPVKQDCTLPEVSVSVPRTAKTWVSPILTRTTPEFSQKKPKLDLISRKQQELEAESELDHTDDELVRKKTIEIVARSPYTRSPYAQHPASLSLSVMSESDNELEEQFHEVEIWCKIELKRSRKLIIWICENKYARQEYFSFFSLCF